MIDWKQMTTKETKSLLKKLEKGKEEENQNKIQKESGAKKNVIKQKKEQHKYDKIQNKENTESNTSV